MNGNKSLRIASLGKDIELQLGRLRNLQAQRKLSDQSKRHEYDELISAVEADIKNMDAELRRLIEEAAADGKTLG